MGGIDKYPLERMQDKSVKLSFRCPLCKGCRIEMSNEDDIDFFKGVKCPKCKSLILLDNLSVTVVKEGFRPETRTTKQTLLRH